jgi:acetyl-CoA hydrolase
MSSTGFSATLKSRIRRNSMLQKLCHPEDLLHHFPNGAYVGWSGFTGVGYPKCVRLSARCFRLPGHGPRHSN